MVYVCAEKDIECGDHATGWCSDCPKRGLLQVAVAPNAAAGPYPTPMRPATAAEHKWLSGALKRSLVPAAPSPSSAAAMRQGLEALEHIVRRLRMDMDDGGRPDYWSMEDLVRKAGPAIAALSAELEKTK